MKTRVICSSGRAGDGQERVARRGGGAGRTGAAFLSCRMQEAGGVPQRGVSGSGTQRGLWGSRNEPCLQAGDAMGTLSVAAAGAGPRAPPLWGGGR